MANEFTDEELGEIIRAARVFDRSLSEEQFQSMVELQGHLADSSYLKTVCPIHWIADRYTSLDLQRSK